MLQLSLRGALMKVIDDVAFLEALKSRVTGARAEYKALYSTFLGGVTTSPHHMVVPIDDHMVHRGDAVFEAVKFVEVGGDRSAIYALDRHLDRIEISAKTIGLKVPMPRTELVGIIKEVTKLSKLETGVIRLYISRGPGGFTANPYESIGAQIYCAITKLTPPSPEKFVSGVRCGRSRIPVKEGFFAQTKSCNYLQNVLMKKESIDRELDFTVSVDADGFMAESSTENFALISADGAVLAPTYDRILRGVTLVRALELAESIGLKVESRRFMEEEVFRAKGALIMGTTNDILPVARYEGHSFGAMPRETRELMRAFADDLRAGPLLTTV